MKRVFLTFARVRALICAVICAVAASGCTDAQQIPADDFAISITTETANVPFGAPFVLTVDRVWDAALRPEEWSDETLSPLVVRQRSVSLHEGDGRVLERRVFDAHAYVVGDVRVLPPLFVAVDPAHESERETSGEGLDLYVTATLDPAAPGAIELPPGPPEPALAWAALLAGLAALVAVGAALVVTARRRSSRADQPRAAVPVPAGPEVAALSRLAALRTRTPSSSESLPLFYDDVAGALRAYVVARYSWGTEQATSDELAHAGAGDAPALRSLLARCDLVRFAMHDPGADGVALVLDDAEHFIRETAE